MKYTKLHFLPLAQFVVFLPCASSHAEEGIELRERATIGGQHQVQSRTEISGKLTLPAQKKGDTSKTISISGHSTIDYAERILSLDRGGDVDKTIRAYRRLSFERITDGRKQNVSLRKSVARIIVLRKEAKEVPFSPDGPLNWGEIDLIRTDVFFPALKGLLPRDAVRVGDRWNAAEAAVRELTDLEKITKGSVECRFERISTKGGRKLVQVRFSGSIDGINEDGPSRQKLEGEFYFDIEAKHVSYVSLRGRHSLLDENGKEMGHVEGRFVLSRHVKTSDSLSDPALRGVTLEPNRASTLLLFDDSSLKLRFLYPRRWHVSSAQGKQVTLETSTGDGLILTVDPRGKGPTTKQFFRDSRDSLEKRNARLRRVKDPHLFQRSPTSIDRFIVEAELNRQLFVMDSYRLQCSGGDATVAARLLPDGLSATQKEVEEIVRSIRIGP